jgi:hypothetical protein
MPIGLALYLPASAIGLPHPPTASRSYCAKPEQLKQGLQIRSKFGRFEQIWFLLNWDEFSNDSIKLSVEYRFGQLQILNLCQNSSIMAHSRTPAPSKRCVSWIGQLDHVCFNL